MATLTTDRVFGAVEFDKLLSRTTPFNSPQPCFDLSSVQMIKPAGLVQLAAACQYLSAVKRHVTIRVTDLSVRAYLSRTGFIDCVRSYATFEPPMLDLDLAGEAYRSGRTPLLLEVTPLRNASDLRPVLDHVVLALRSILGFSIPEACDVATAVSELCQNTFEHNGSGCGFVAMQVYGRDAKRFLEAAVADCGEGLAATLRRNPRDQSMCNDAQAIRCATQLGISQFDDPTRGTGLFHLLRIARKHGACVQIRSGCAKVRYRMDQGRSLAMKVPWAPGVQVVLDVDTKRQS